MNLSEFRTKIKNIQNKQPPDLVENKKNQYLDPSKFSMSYTKKLSRYQNVVNKIKIRRKVKLKQNRK